MNTSIKTKLLLIMLLTLTVAIGGTILYGNFLEKSSNEIALMNEGIFITPSPQLQSSEEQTSYDKKSPKYKPSLRKSSVRSQATTETDLLDSKSLVSGYSASRSSSVATSTGYRSYTKKNDKDGIYTSNPMLLSQYQAGGRSSKGMSTSGGGAVSSSVYSSGMTHLTGPMLGGEAFAENGAPNVGNPNNPSDDFLPPEGTPVGNGLWFMLLLAGIYALYNNLKEKVKF